MPNTKKSVKSLLFILFVAILGVILYFYKLESIPSGFYIDEALPAYNAYSLIETGKDEYGKTSPLVFRFYGSFNPPIYIYLTAASMSFFGINVFAARFASSLSGLLTVLVVYFLLKKSHLFKEEIIPVTGAIFAVISPWLILHSRVGYEISTALFLFALGILLAWQSLKKSKFLVYSFFFLSLSTYAAYTQRFIVPLFILIYVAVFRKRLVNKTENKKRLIYAVVIALVTQIPHFYLLTTPAFFPKSDLFATGAVAAQTSKISNFLPGPLSYILAYTREILSQYVTYFSPRSLFFLPDPDGQRSIPELSTFYFWMVVPYFAGIYLLWKKRQKDFVKFLLILAFISPIPAAFTKSPFSTHRALPLFLPIILIITLGYRGIIKLLPNPVRGLVTIGLVSLSLTLLWRGYFVLFPQERAKEWGYGIHELAKIIKENPDINFVIDQTRAKPVYMQLAFFLKYPPKEFQKIASNRIKKSYYEEVDFNQEYKFSNIHTRNIIWGKDIYKKQILVGDRLSISNDQAKEHFLEKVFEIRDPLGEIVFLGYETNPKLKCRSLEYENKYCKNFQ